MKNPITLWREFRQPWTDVKTLKEHVARVNFQGSPAVACAKCPDAPWPCPRVRAAVGRTAVGQAVAVSRIQTTIQKDVS